MTLAAIGTVLAPSGSAPSSLGPPSEALVPVSLIKTHSGLECL